MSLQEQIEQKIFSELNPIHFELVNESSKHKHGGSESHFKLLVVSSKFEGMLRIERQKWIYQLLQNEMQQGIHALAQKMLTPTEWQATKKDFKTPDCKG